LSDEGIIDFQVGDKGFPAIAHTDAALFLWCTSANLERALSVMIGGSTPPTGVYSEHRNYTDILQRIEDK
jgi:hypothetical protein